MNLLWLQTTVSYYKGKHYTLHPTKKVRHTDICIFIIFFRVRFTIVSEPPEEVEDGDCEDVGVAFVSVRDILKNRKDVIDVDMPSKFIML